MLASVVVRVLDLQSVGCGFESHKGRFQECDNFSGFLLSNGLFVFCKTLHEHYQVTLMYQQSRYHPMPDCYIVIVKRSVQVLAQFQTPSPS